MGVETSNIFFRFVQLGSENAVVNRLVKLDSCFDGGIAIHGSSVIKIR